MIQSWEKGCLKIVKVSNPIITLFIIISYKLFLQPHGYNKFQ